MSSSMTTAWTGRNCIRRISSMTKAIAKPSKPASPATRSSTADLQLARVCPSCYHGCDEHAPDCLRKGLAMEIKPPPGTPASEVSQRFFQGMADRMGVSFAKYGAVCDAYPHRVNALASLRARLD